MHRERMICGSFGFLAALGKNQQRSGGDKSEHKDLSLH
jgi:hypothetical protein